MSSVVIKGDTSGQVTLAAPAVAGTVTVTLPSASGTMATNVNGDLYPLTSGTAVASTSGTSIDFTGIPSWVKRITVNFSGVSTSGTSIPIIQLGDSGGIETTSYLSTGSRISTTSAASTSVTNGLGIGSVAVATGTMYGSVTISLLGSNAWTAAGVVADAASAFTLFCSGGKTLSDTLTQIRITTVGGTDTFDAGSINILYE